MLDREQIVADFHDKMGQAIEADWTPDLLELRHRLVMEEFQELSDEFVNISVKLDNGQRVTKTDKASFLKELADLQYVISGCAVALGLSLEDAFLRVHMSNLSKLDDDGRPVYRDDGKVMKSRNYQPPVMHDLIID